MNQQERYNAMIMKRYNEQGSGVRDFSGPIAPGVGRDAIDASVKRGETDLQNNKIASSAEGSVGAGVSNAGEKMGAQMAQSAAQQGSLAGTAGGAMMMTGNPYLMAGGLGLTVLAAGEQNKRAAEEKQRTEYNERIRDRQAMMNQIASMGIK
jgi:hypothetical protein